MQADYQGSVFELENHLFAVLWGSVVLESLILAEKETEPACFSIDSSKTVHCDHNGGIAGLVNLEGKLLLISVAMARERLGSGKKAARQSKDGVAGLRLAGRPDAGKRVPLEAIVDGLVPSLGSSCSAKWRISESARTSLGHS